MLFSSYSFVLYFFPACLLLSLAFRRFAGLRYYILFLTASSLLFYSFSGIHCLLLMLFSIVFNYGSARIIRNAVRYKKLFLGLAVGVNLLLLIYFKYTNFFVETFNQVTGDSLLYSVILPVGISFYTFQQIMYLADTYKGKVTEHGFIMYVLYISFFPHLIAGPIVTHDDYFPQFRDKKTLFNISENVAVGLSFFAYGLFKKIVIADQLEAMFVNPVFDQSLTGPVTFWEAWIGTVAYAFQIYYDFSGYSDMAVGLGKCLGVELPQNFNSPYKSKSPREFWRRWHMSLSFFLRDYLYIPLGGSRVSALRKNFNIILTMFLAGLWHGAGWGFMIWGFLHGVGIAASHWIGDRAGWIKNVPVLNWRITPWAVTFTFVCLCWVPFRGESMASIFEVWRSMFALTEIFTTDSLLYGETRAVVLPLLLLHCLFCPNLFQIFRDRLHFAHTERLDPVEGRLKEVMTWKPALLWAGSAALAFYVSFLFMGTVNSFIYFQF